MIRRAVFFTVLIASTGVAQVLPQAITADDYPHVRLEEAMLGQLLFYDPILSGNRNIACATCHHPAFGTSDGVSLALGEGAIGLGPERQINPSALPERRIPRNAPALFNLGAREFTVLFHDGRLELDPDSLGGIRTPMDADMITGFASLLSAQTMFPVLSRDEMAGNHRENEIGRAVRQGVITGPGGAWDIIARRVAGIPEYADSFVQVYPQVSTPDDIAFTDVSNAIAAFMAHEWRSHEAPFDEFLRGDVEPNERTQAGIELFYGRARCSTCHAGPFQTDHQFHAMGAPQIGPGKAANFEDHHRDEGRFRVTGDARDLYAFRTPSLRNVAVTGPYGHAGAHQSLRAFMRHHLDPMRALARFDPSTVTLPAFEADDFVIMHDKQDRDAIAQAVTTPVVTLTEDELSDLMAFLNTLTDPVVLKGRLGVPERVPSGLPVPNP